MVTVLIAAALTAAGLVYILARRKPAPAPIPVRTKSSRRRNI